MKVVYGLTLKWFMYWFVCDLNAWLWKEINLTWEYMLTRPWNKGIRLRFWHRPCTNGMTNKWLEAQGIWIFRWSGPKAYPQPYGYNHWLGTKTNAPRRVRPSKTDRGKRLKDHGYIMRPPSSSDLHLLIRVLETKIRHGWSSMKSCLEELGLLRP